MTSENKGKLIIIGGAEDKTTDKIILKEVFHLAQGEQSRICIITTATCLPIEVGCEYKKLFTDLGCKQVEAINITDRNLANQENYFKGAKEATCLFFVGGDQLRISSLLGGTRFHQLILNKYKEGCIIAGTSAGASMMSEIMIVKGLDDDAPRKCTMKMAPGMSLMHGVIIDQHFNQRGRLGRLLNAVAQNPIVLGIGIDENTAIVVAEEKFTVIGSGVATVVDGREIEYTNVSELHPDLAMAITNVKLHILPQSYGFDLLKKIVLIGGIEEDTK